MQKKRRGFTLVEIMIVVLIIGILLAIAIPNFIRARQISYLREIQGAANTCQKDTGKPCGRSDIVPKYLATWPDDDIVMDNGTAIYKPSRYSGE